jgi:NADH:ubiquinone oxidoreductase subunit 5 (subunit L)/multisubunit Na+/H+ antiporter MnhA subunit
MEAPTPVSALLHAATLVTAGIYLLLRSSPILEYSTTALLIITLIGASTAFFGATVGLVSNDLKRIIAMSTISQLGYYKIIFLNIIIIFILTLNNEFNHFTIHLLHCLNLPIYNVSNSDKKDKFNFILCYKNYINKYSDHRTNFKN